MPKRKNTRTKITYDEWRKRYEECRDAQLTLAALFCRNKMKKLEK